MTCLTLACRYVVAHIEICEPEYFFIWVHKYTKKIQILLASKPIRYKHKSDLQVQYLAARLKLHEVPQHINLKEELQYTKIENSPVNKHQQPGKRKNEGTRR